MADQALAQRDKEFWTTRMRALSSLAATDALAVILPLGEGRYVSFAEHNVGQDPGWLDGAAQYLIRSAVKERTVQRRGEIQVALADGRFASSIVVAPIAWSGRIVGVLVALRVAAVYEPSVGAPTAELADLVGLELAVSSALQRGTAEHRAADTELRRALDDRRHAIALYEVSRIALRAEGEEKIAAVVADALGYGLVGVWVDDGGWLRLADGHGYPHEPGRAQIDSDAALQRVVRDGDTERVRLVEMGGAAWLGGAGEVIAAPLSTDGAGRGMLVLGLPARPFTAADLTLAPTLAETVGLARARRAPPAPSPRAATSLPAAEVAGASLPLPSAAVWPVLTATPAPDAAAPRRRGWVIPLLVLAVSAGAVGAYFGQASTFVLAGLLILVALWGWFT